MEKIFIFSDLRNFNDDIFRKDVTYNIKIKIKKKKTGPHSLSKKYIFGKTRGQMSN